MAVTTWSTTDRLNVTLSGGNLIVTASASAGGVRSIDRATSGKFYWEVTVTTANASTDFGIAGPLATLSGSTTALVAVVSSSSGAIVVNTAAQTGIGAISNGGVVCIALDLNAQLVWFRNGAAGNWNGSGTANPATGTGGYSVAAFGGGAFPLYAFMGCTGTGGVITANFGGGAFTGAVPAGFTSGFTAGAVIGTNELASQIAAEHWAQAIPPPMQATQAALEHWVTVNITNPHMAATQVAIEQWASVTVANTQARAWILA